MAVPLFAPDYGGFFEANRGFQYVLSGVDVGEGSGASVWFKTRTRNNICSLEDHRQQSIHLFADDVWPGSFVLADYLCSHPELVIGRNIVELGAGGALPSLVAARLGANRIIITDYPEESILNNIEELVRENRFENTCFVKGHAWGEDVQELLRLIAKQEHQNSNVEEGFDVILVAEPLWKDTYSLHRPLLASISGLLNRSNGIALMAFAHRPTLQHPKEKDLELFECAQNEFGLVCLPLGSVAKYKDVGEMELAEVHLFSLSHCHSPI